MIERGSGLGMGPGEQARRAVPKGAGASGLAGCREAAEIRPCAHEHPEKGVVCGKGWRRRWPCASRWQAAHLPPVPPVWRRRPRDASRRRRGLTSGRSGRVKSERHAAQPDKISRQPPVGFRSARTSAKRAFRRYLVWRVPITWARSKGGRVCAIQTTQRFRFPGSGKGLRNK